MALIGQAVKIIAALTGQAVNALQLRVQGGDEKYKTERDGLFGEKSAAHIYVISAIPVGISPALGVAAPVISPLVALTLASIGKVAINAWCAQDDTGSA